MFLKVKKKFSLCNKFYLRISFGALGFAVQTTMCGARKSHAGDTPKRGLSHQHGAAAGRSSRTVAAFHRFAQG